MAVWLPCTLQNFTTPTLQQHLPQGSYFECEMRWCKESTRHAEADAGQVLFPPSMSPESPFGRPVCPGHRRAQAHTGAVRGAEAARRGPPVGIAVVRRLSQAQTASDPHELRRISLGRSVLLRIGCLGHSVSHVARSMSEFRFREYPVY